MAEPVAQPSPSAKRWKPRLWHRIRYAGLPIAALIRRELLTTLRLKRTFWFAGFFAAFLVWNTIIAWPDASISWSSRGGWAREFLVRNSWWLLAAGALTIPAFAATSIVSEREKNTLDLVWGTGIGPLTFLLAKLGASLVYYLLTLTVALPCIAVLYFLIGVDFWTLAAVAFLLLSCAASTAAAGLWVSCRARNSIGALIVSYFSLLITQGILWYVLVLMAIFLDLVDITDYITEEQFSVVMPLFVMVTSIGNQGGGSAPTTLLLQAAGFQFFLASLFLIFAYVTVRRKLFRDRPMPRANSPRKSKLFKRGGRLGYRRSKYGAGLWGIARLELRHFLFRDRRISYIPLLILIFGAVIPVAFLWYVKEFGTFSTYLYEFALFNAYAVALIYASLLAPLLVVGYRIRDKQMGNEDALRMSLLRPWTVYWGKYLGGCLTAGFLIFVAVLIESALWLPERYFRFEKVIHVLGVGATSICALVALSVTMLFGTYMKQIGSALIASYLAIAGMFIGIPILASRFFDVSGSDTEAGLRWYLALSPPTAVVDVMRVTQERWPDINYWKWYLLGYVIFSLCIASLGYSRFAKLWRRGDD